MTTALPAAHMPGAPISNVGALVARCCRLYADHLAVTSASKNLSYAALEQRSNRLANALLAQGLQRGDRVGIYLPNCTEIVEIELACYKAGLVKAPFNARLSPREVIEIADNSDAALIVTTAERAESFRAQLRNPQVRLMLLGDNENNSYERLLEKASDQFSAVSVHEHEVAVLHYTSGSSGTLKAAMQTFGNRLAQLRKFLMRGEGMQPGHTLGLVGPVTHASGMQLMPALCTGATIHLFSSFEPARFLQDMRSLRVTHTFMVPTMINMLLAETAGRYRPCPICCAWAMAPPPWHRPAFCRPWMCSAPCSARAMARAKPPRASARSPCRTIFMPAPPGPSCCPPAGGLFSSPAWKWWMTKAGPAQGEVGEIVVSGADVFAGYWRAPELTAEVLKHGRYHTGDLARVDEQGFVYIVDRKKDMVISGGFNVYPSEVEAVLHEHAAVQDACVFAIPDDKWGEAVAAHIVLKQGQTPGDAGINEAIDRFCAERLGGFKRPRHIEFVQQLPKNPNGKVMRKTVQAPYWANHSRKVN
jgi:acyl-CoA synthetase (AMP-forming)/AMP-acid ligase II